MSHRSTRSHTARTPSLALALVALLAWPLAAGAQQQWVSINGNSPGTPAEVLLEPSDSDEENTVVEIRIHGFWREDVTGADGNVYQRLTFPGLGQTDRIGGPELPSARFAIGVGTDAGQVEFLGADVEEQFDYEAIRVYPMPIPGEDEEFDPTWDPGPGDTVGTEETWAFDAGIYGGGAAWPYDFSEGAVVEPMIGPVSGATMYCNPVQWNPTNDTLTVYSKLKAFFSHQGQANEPLTLTKLSDKIMAQAFVNWPLTQIVYPPDLVQYHSRYLIVCNNVLYFNTLEPFIQHKKALGYEVTLVASLVDVANIRGDIQTWYQAGDPGKDHFVLLIGDTNLVPLGLVTPGGQNVWSDDVYGTVGAINGSKEVHVGRISVDSETNLGDQLQKIMDYELAPVPGGDYHKALLVAHKQEGPGKYTLSHTKVMSASYSQPPFFLTSFGYTGGTNQQVMNFIGAGLGLVAYRGHGSTTTWSDWNTSGENFHKNDVGTLMNTERPVVWAITCTNANLDWGFGGNGDSISEVWMEAGTGAVASYGATRTTSTNPNHYLNETLFKVVYDWGITTHSMATELAETALWLNWPGQKNPWCYLLLGDPSMQIRRTQAAELVFQLQPFVSPDEPVQMDFLATDDFGEPPVEGLVSLYKASFLNNQPDELLAAYWLDDNGFAALGPFDMQTPGTLYVTVRDGNGNMSQQSVEVKMGSAWADLGNGLGGANGTPALASTGPLTGGSIWGSYLTNAPPGATAYWCFSFGALNAPFKGGVLVPDIGALGFFIPLGVDESGNIAFTAPWPDGVPGGVSIYQQYWIPDATGPFGFTASNAVVGTTP